MILNLYLIAKTNAIVLDSIFRPYFYWIPAKLVKVLRKMLQAPNIKGIAMDFELFNRTFGMKKDRRLQECNYFVDAHLHHTRNAGLGL